MRSENAEPCAQHSMVSPSTKPSASEMSPCVQVSPMACTSPAESIPNLEIETGDIRGAGHASATGRFDDEQLFYLQARGIPEPEARRLVVLGFLSEIVQRIGVPALEGELTELIERELAQGISASAPVMKGESA